MKIVIRNLLIFFVIGLVFTCGIVLFYDGNLYHFDIVLEGALLFAVITLLLEKIMMVVYVRLKLPSLVRAVITIVSGILLYTAGVWLTKPWLLYKVFNIPVFMLAILPMFLIFAIAFEIYFIKRMKKINENLNRLKNNNQNTN